MFLVREQRTRSVAELPIVHSIQTSECCEIRTEEINRYAIFHIRRAAAW